MSAARPLLWIQAGARASRGPGEPPSPGRPEAFPGSDAALARTWLDLAERMRAGRLPLEALLQLFQFALVQRLRESPDGLLGIELWPQAVAAALDAEAHGMDELWALAPPCDVALADADDAAFAEAGLRLLGLPLLAPERYAALLDETAPHSARVRLRELDPLGGVPERATASALLVRDGSVLLERRPPGAQVTPGVWDSPGGHLEACETPHACLLRELREELGIALPRAESAQLVDVHDKLEHPPGARYRHFVYRVDEWTGDARSREKAELAWHPLAELPSKETVNPALVPVLRAL